MLRNRLYSILIAVLVIANLGFAPSAGAYSTPQDEQVGGLDSDQYCRGIGATHHVKDPNQGETNVGCQFDSGGPIQWLSKGELDDACKLQYGNDAYSHRNSDDPDSWVCWGPPNHTNQGRERVSGIDFDGYCRTLGATHQVQDAHAYIWGMGCQFGSGGSIQWLHQYNIDEACHQQAGSDTYAAVAGNKPDSWYCARGGGEDILPEIAPHEPGPGSDGGGNLPNPHTSNGNDNNGSSDSGNNSQPDDGVNRNACSDGKHHIGGQSQPPSGKSVVPTINNLLLRSNPSQDDCVYGWVNQGEYYSVIDEKSGWYKISTSERDGWVMGSYVTVTTSSDNSSSSNNSGSSDSSGSTGFDNGQDGANHAPKEQCFIIFCVQVEASEPVDTRCTPQCIETARNYRPDIEKWSRGGTSVNILNQADDGTVFIWNNRQMKVRVRNAGESPQVGDLVIWPGNCDHAWPSGGHIGYVSGTNPFRINDSNWNSHCELRENFQLSILPCMRFVTAPYPIDGSANSSGGTNSSGDGFPDPDLSDSQSSGSSASTNTDNKNSDCGFWESLFGWCK